MYKYKCSCLKLRYVLRILVYSLEKNETATVFFLKKPFLVDLFILSKESPNQTDLSHTCTMYYLFNNQKGSFAIHR